MIDVVGKEKVKKVRGVSYWLDNYNDFMKARNLGIKFGPRDIDLEQLEVFTIIKDKLEELEKPNKKKGKR